MIFQVVSDCPSLCAVMMSLGIIQLCKTNVIWGWHERKWSAPCIYANKITFSSIYKELISTLLLHISLTHCSLPSIPIELPKNPFRTLACVTWHTGCGNLPAILLTLLTVFHSPIDVLCVGRIQVPQPRHLHCTFNPTRHAVGVVSDKLTETEFFFLNGPNTTNKPFLTSTSLIFQWCDFL